MISYKENSLKRNTLVSSPKNSSAIASSAGPF